MNVKKKSNNMKFEIIFSIEGEPNMKKNMKNEILNPIRRIRWTKVGFST
ncbi:hypothetical protein NEF87_000906 [Candidatus Lokiarchaeum ossiferum]|uniref:Uncharacterized protein n=1 Tax=Candidatus Lokiarchaeum ossiferum TaxID=2951803 RepID=A0ABY6HM79_9ARCH|nr:hypothetical protein NEF87_000906 [Candidatus Lokiarchaeum sp. B-35]